MLTFRVEKLVPGGYGLGRTERGVVLVKGALPGELVRGEPKRKKGALFLEAPEILEAHPGRYPEPPPPSAGPYQKSYKSKQFSSFNFSTLFHAKSRKSAKMETQKGPPLEAQLCQNGAKRRSRKQ